MSKRLVLFSQPSPIVFEKLSTALFPVFLPDRRIAYMPSDGSNVVSNAKYTPVWEQFVKKHDATFEVIDNSKRGDDILLEIDKILKSNILLIAGGNTFVLLNHLRQSGLDQAITDFWNRKHVVLAGFSAGAIVLTTSIETARTGVSDADEIGLTSLTALSIVDFEVWPHYNPNDDPEIVKYRSSHPNELKLIGNEDVIAIDY